MILAPPPTGRNTFRRIHRRSSVRNVAGTLDPYVPHMTFHTTMTTDRPPMKPTPAQGHTEQADTAPPDPDQTRAHLNPTPDRSRLDRSEACHLLVVRDDRRTIRGRNT